MKIARIGSGDFWRLTARNDADGRLRLNRDLEMSGSNVGCWRKAGVDQRWQERPSDLFPETQVSQRGSRTDQWTREWVRNTSRYAGSTARFPSQVCRGSSRTRDQNFLLCKPASFSTFRAGQSRRQSRSSRDKR